jgi:outer membrane protein assembly factor BamD (BamD/ComL family)
MVVSTQHGSEKKPNSRKQGHVVAACFFLASAFFLCGASGCAWDSWNLFATPKPPPPPAESMVLRGDRLETEARPLEGTGAADLAGTHELYRSGEYGKAERIYRKIADNTKNSPPVAEEARYYEAECLRRQEKYPKAADTYNKLLTDFPSGAYREQAVQHIFEIANYWLDDTRKDMEVDKDIKEGKKWFAVPNIIHFETARPLFDEEGRAIEKLEQVRYNDMTGPLADKALFLAGSVKFFRKDYKDADQYFTQLVDMHPNSPFAEQALELGIISKQLSTGGALYDGRKVAEARRLVDTALRNYPGLASKKAEFLNRQLYSITMQQAEKDFETAEFYSRRGHPCSAYFCYETVRRRYPGTKYFDMATERMQELRIKLEKSGAKTLPEVPKPGELDTMPLPGKPITSDLPEFGPSSQQPQSGRLLRR